MVKRMRLICRTALLVLLSMSVGMAFANPTDSASLMNEQFKLYKSNGLFKLDVTKMKLPSTLKLIAKSQQLAIHITDLPDTLMSTTCTGTELSQLLECLLDNKADLIVRYKQVNPIKHHNKAQIAEAWVVTSTSGDDKKTTENQTTVDMTGQDNPLPAPLINNDGNGTVKVDDLLDKAQSNDKKQKALALGALLMEGHKGDPAVRAVLEQALADQDPEVRAQAVSGLAHREGSDALFAVEQGLQDDSEDVRLIAVEGIKGDIALLQRAINDSDEAVRSLAEIKLQLLTDNNPSNNTKNQ